MQNLIITLLLPLSLFAQTYSLNKSKIKFKIPYTMGTHEGKSKSLSGSFNLKTGGKFTIPIESLKTGNQEMDCHLYESLGLNYDNSEFPEEHVCDDDKLPSEGKNSIVYPDITYTVEKVISIEDSENKKAFKLQGFWTIHGKKNSKDYDLVLIKNENNWTSKLSFELKLSDFDVIVKKFLFISVDNTISLDLSLTMEKK
jgi:polyisoprenoid-binding protein YceI